MSRLSTLTARAGVTVALAGAITGIGAAGVANAAPTSLPALPTCTADGCAGPITQHSFGPKHDACAGDLFWFGTCLYRIDYQDFDADPAGRVWWVSWPD